jgi:membrane protein YqaA with SNARE-associated domain
MFANSSRPYRWLKLGLAFLAFVAISLGIGFLIQYLLARHNIRLNLPAWEGLLLIFGVLLVVNLSVLPLPFGVSLMLVAADHWNPALVALVGSAGASLGEFSSYFFGYLSKRLSIDENTPGYKMVQRWIHRYGMWAIALLSFQPIIPFELGGFIAGLVKMPISKFLPAIWIGKFPKYLILIYLGGTVLNLFHFSQVK